MSFAKFLYVLETSFLY